MSQVPYSQSFCFLPYFLAIAIAVKLSSKGPVFFKQQRVGEYGSRFTFLKFRSMYVNNSAEKHKEYVKKLIAGQAEKKEGGTFKLTDDPRITRWANGSAAPAWTSCPSSSTF